jgi:[acyl-carrier-protein] S-malonyltransferase
MSNLAFIFPGQGSQQVGMGRALAEHSSIARDTFAEADAILGFSLSTLCFEGPAETLTETRNAQPAILVASIAAWRALRAERGDLPAPCCLAGHSLGEYSALVASGALEFADAVRLTRSRGEAMACAGAEHPGSMAAVLRLTDDQVASICNEAAERSGNAVQVANYNSPGQVVISGSAGGVATATELAKAAGGRVMPLAVSVAAHSVLMTSAAADFAPPVANTSLANPGVTVIGNVHATPLASVAEIRAELVAQLTSPVQWTRSMLTMAANGATRFVEIGPGNVLTGLARRIDPAFVTANVSEPEHITALAA